MVILKLNKKEKKKFFHTLMKQIKTSNHVNEAKNKFSEILEMPQEVLSNYTRITSIENTDVLIEGYKKIVDYGDNFIKIKTNNRFVIIDGLDLDIKEITDSELVISGKISSLNYRDN